MSAPILKQTSPADNLSGVAATVNLVLTFDQIVRLGTSGTIRIYESDGTLFHTISVTDASQVSLAAGRRPSKVTINPNVDLDPGTSYYVLIDAGTVENRNGQDFAGISSPTAFNFTTAGSPPGDTTAPTLTSTSPLDNAMGVAVGSNLVLTFSETVQAGTGLIVIHNAVGGSIAKTILAADTSQVSFSGNQLTINPTTDLAENHAYYVTITLDAVRDPANNNFGGVLSSTAFNFTTAGTADTTAPILTNTSPLDNATDVDPEADIVLTFNENVQAGFGDILIRASVNNVIVYTIQAADDGQVTFSGNQMTIDPNIGLIDGSYYVTLANGAVTDIAGNSYLGFSSSTTLNFTTGPGTTDPGAPSPFTLPTSGAYTNTVTGSRRADNLTGNSANNRLDGRQGSDTMTGLAGDDTYVVDTASDNVVESLNNGIDTVISSASSYTLANNVENLTLTGTNTHTATGNDLNNLIIASTRPDIINAGAGNDILRAGTGACVLTGGAGNDIFDFDVMGSQKQISDFTVGQDLADLRTLLAWYGGSDPLADNAIALSAVAGGVLVSVKASAGGSLQGLVKITGVSLGDLDIGADILWDA